MPDQLDLRPGDVAEVVADERGFDRCVLDVPEPWGQALPALQGALEPGVVLCTCHPTTVQLQQLVLALPAHASLHIESFETLLAHVARG